MIQPEKGSEAIKPIGIAISMPPKAANVSPSCCWTLAIREAQLEKHKPAIKNIAPTAIRSTNFDLRELSKDVVIQRALVLLIHQGCLLQIYHILTESRFLDDFKRNRPLLSNFRLQLHSKRVAVFAVATR